MFQFGEGVRKSFNNAGVDGAVDGLVWSSKILGACKIKWNTLLSIAVRLDNDQKIS